MGESSIWQFVNLLKGREIGSLEPELKRDQWKLSQIRDEEEVELIHLEDSRNMGTRWDAGLNPVCFVPALISSTCTNDEWCVCEWTPLIENSNKNIN